LGELCHSETGQFATLYTYILHVFHYFTHSAGVNLAKSTGHFNVINSAFMTKNNAHLCGAVWTIAHLCQSQLGSEIVRENEWIQQVIHVVQTHHNYLVRGVALSALGLASSSNYVRYDLDCVSFE
jgi:hypothetical protein